MEQYHSQQAYPSAAFFEEAFKRLSPDDVNPQAKVALWDEARTEVPASVLYFNLLRGVVELQKRRERRPEYGKGREEVVTGYLLSDAFMEHATPYLDTYIAYADDLVHSVGKSVFFNTEIQATSDEARALKRERLREVVQITIEYAQQSGNKVTVQNLSTKFASLVQ